jgi:hypothetical protein
MGRVTVSGPDILVDGKVPDHPFFGVCDTTVIAFAIENYINGNHGVAGWSSVFNGPDTGSRMPVTPNDTPDAFWNQYFAQMASYGVNMLRIGPHDIWGSGISYNAWANHRDQYFDLLHSMAYYAQVHGVYLAFVMGGSQEFPAFQWGGDGVVFVPGSSAFNHYIEYAKSVMVELENENSIAVFDMFNEPDHDKVSDAYWQGNKVAFNNWANAIADATAGVSTHPRMMGVAGFGKMFGMNQADFNLATGNTRFEILHRHYYGSNSDPYNFQAPEQWADAVGKPLFWGELGYNGVYPLVRYDFGEKTIWAAGGQAITSMVLTGTSGYPYHGGVTGKGQVPMPADWPEKSVPPVQEPKEYNATIYSSYVGQNRYAFGYTTNLDNGVASNQWNFDDGNSSTEKQLYHTFAPGNYTVTLTVVGKDGTKVTDTVDVSAKDVVPVETNTTTNSTAGNISVPSTGGAGKMTEGTGQSIAGAVEPAAFDTALVAVGLISAIIVGFIGYIGMARGVKISKILDRIPEIKYSRWKKR